MKGYRVLSSPKSTRAPNYRGLYRSEPFPRLNSDKHFTNLWRKYIESAEPLINMGITKELTIDELKHFAYLATQDTGKSFEVICYNEYLECPHQSEYYGIDVVGVGGYSMVGENFFTDSNDNGIYHYWDVINQFFRSRLNSNGLFNQVKDAISFRAILNELDSLSPGIIEDEDWKIIHIFKVT